MNELQKIAVSIVYAQAILAGVWALTWLGDKAFERVLLSLRVKNIFREFLIDRALKHGGGFRKRSHDTA